MNLEKSLEALEEAAMNLVDQDRDIDRVLSMLMILATNKLCEEMQEVKEHLKKPFGAQPGLWLDKVPERT